MCQELVLIMSDLCLTPTCWDAFTMRTRYLKNVWKMVVMVLTVVIAFILICQGYMGDAGSDGFAGPKESGEAGPAGNDGRPGADGEKGVEVEKGKLKIAKLDQMTIVVLTMNRADSLRRLLDSLERADYGGDNVSLIIKVDKSKNNNNVPDLANSFKFSHGPKHVFFASTNKGLRGAWFDAWTPRDDFDRGVILEDDLEVSPQWYVWLRAAWAAYGPRTDMAGVSLCRQVLVPKLPNKKMSIINNHVPFMYALLGSEGFSPHPKQWLAFLSWIKSIDVNKFDVSTPDLVTSVWWNATNKRMMWTQHFIYFTRRHDLYTVYVNLPDKKTLSAHHREKGAHVGRTRGRDFELATSVKIDFPKVLTKYGWDGLQIGVAANKTILKK